MVNKKIVKRRGLLNRRGVITSYAARFASGTRWGRIEYVVQNYLIRQFHHLLGLRLGAVGVGKLAIRSIDVKSVIEESLCFGGYNRL